MKAFVLFLTCVLGLNALAQTPTKFQTDVLQFGRGSALIDKVISVDAGATDPFLKWDNAIQKWVFSNDGLAQKPIGEGSGGGESNLLANNSFEDPLFDAEWTFTGTSTKSEETTFVIDGEKSFKVTSTAQSFRLEQKVTTNASQLAGLNGNASVYLLNGQVGDQVCAIVDDVDVNCVDVLESTTWKQYVVSFVFGGTNNGIVVKSSSRTGSLYVDNAKVVLGTTQNVAQARLLGTLTYAATTNCVWTTTSTTAVAFAADADCPTPTVTGDIQAPDTKIPAFVIPAGITGSIQVVARGQFGISRTTQTTQDAVFYFNDGTTTSTVGRLRYSDAISTTSDAQYPNLSFGFSKTSGSAQTIQLYGSVFSSGQSIDISASVIPFVFDVYYYPPANKIFSADSLGWFIDANIGGANPDLGVANVSTYTEITNAGLDLVVNTAKGSQSAKILCSGTNPPTGTTCAAGSESVGIAFTIPKAPAQYEVCADFINGPTTSATAGSSVATSFQLIETPTNAQTNLQLGGDRKESRIASVNASTNQGLHFPIKTCGVFNFSSSGEKAVRLMYEQIVASSPSASILVADRNTSSGQRDIHFTVKPAINLERINGSFAQIEDALEEVYVYAHSSSTVVTGTGNTITFATEVVDTLGAFNPATGIFTAPVDGIYTISGTFTSTATALSATQILALVAVGNGISHTLERVYGNGSSNQWGATGAVSVRLAAGQTARIQGTASVDLTGDNSQSNTWITISRIPTP